MSITQNLDHFGATSSIYPGESKDRPRTVNQAPRTSLVGHKINPRAPGLAIIVHDAPGALQSVKTCAMNAQ